MGHLPQEVINEINLLNQSLILEGKKKCRRCRDIKSTDDFHRERDGYKPYCKACLKVSYYDKDRTRENGKRWRKENPEAWRVITRRVKSKPHCKIRAAMRKRIMKFLGATESASHWRDHISGTPKELVTHLETQFSPSMSWTNYGSFWHIDHIVPCAAFDASKPNHLKWCWHFKNLRPLAGVDNVAKGDLLSNGEEASALRALDLERLKQVAGADLERLGIATAQEYAASWDSPTQVVYVTV